MLFHFLATVLLEFPVTVVERADLACLKPAGDAVEVERVLQIRQSPSSLDQDACLWKLTLQIPQATVHSSLVADAWFA